jgi:hypothetical protein
MLDTNQPAVAAGQRWQDNTPFCITLQWSKTHSFHFLIWLRVGFAKISFGCMLSESFSI